MKIKGLKIRGLTPDELIHWIRSFCCVLPVDDSEIKIYGELQIYTSGEKGPPEGEEDTHADHYH